MTVTNTPAGGEKATMALAISSLMEQTNMINKSLQAKIAGTPAGEEDTSIQGMIKDGFTFSFDDFEIGTDIPVVSAGSLKMPSITMPAAAAAKAPAAAAKAPAAAVKAPAAAVTN